MSPAARRTDPETSHDAAKSVKDLGFSHRRIYTLFQKYGPMTDTSLRRVYRDEWLMPISESGLRTRRNELTVMELVVDTGARQKLASGRQSIVWGLREDIDGQS